MAKSSAELEQTLDDKEKVQDFAQMPGPWGLPILGSALSLGSSNPKLLMEWGEQYYGKVFRYKIFSKDYVVLNGYEAIEQGLVRNDDKLSGRIRSPLIEAVRDNKGIFFNDFGEAWKKWKPFAVKAMSEVSKGIPTKICDQALRFLSDLTESGFEDGAALDIKELLKYRMAQIAIISFMSKEFDTRRDLEDVISDIYDMFRSKLIVFLLFTSPWVAILPPVRRYLSTESARRKALSKKFLTWIEEQRSSQQKSAFGDLISRFFEENNPEGDDLEQLTMILADWISAGSATTAHETLWVLLFLLKHPNALGRVKTEIRLALKETDDIEELYHNASSVPYLMACIQESLRLRPIAPTSFFHTAVKESVVAGYKIPKGVTVVPNIWSVHYDPDLWSPDPEAFRPERHLSGDGSFMRSKYVIPFSIGGRRCAGEQLARANIFIILATLLSRYDLKLAPESENIDLTGNFKAILETPEFKIVGKRVKID